MMLIEIAMAKRLLIASPELSAGDRLRVLEGMEKLLDRVFTREAMAAIEPASDGFAAIVAEARTLDCDGDRGMASYRLLTSMGVFDKLQKATPSLNRATEVMCGLRLDAAKRPS